MWTWILTKPCTWSKWAPHSSFSTYLRPRPLASISRLFYFTCIVRCCIRLHAVTLVFVVLHELLKPDWKERGRKMTPMLPSAWIMVWRHLWVDLSLYNSKNGRAEIRGFSRGLPSLKVEHLEWAWPYLPQATPKDFRLKISNSPGRYRGGPFQKVTHLNTTNSAVGCHRWHARLRLVNCIIILTSNWKERKTIPFELV